MMSIKTYSELIRIPSFEDRVKYLQLNGIVSSETFGGHRYLNQILYKSKEWEETRSQIIIRDDGFNLAHSDFPIFGRIYTHHINPITIEDILERNPIVFDPENLVSTDLQTHNCIHYGNDLSMLAFSVYGDRKPNDTTPWR